MFAIKYCHYECILGYYFHKIPGKIGSIRPVSVGQAYMYTPLEIMEQG